MISIVMAYYDRQVLLKKTLDSIKGDDFEVIIVNDGSPKIDESIYPDMDIKTIDIEKKYPNSCIPFNIGFKYAKGDIIVIQNPECMHVGDIVSEAKHCGDNYLSFACYSISKDTVFDENNIINRVVRFDGDDGWYNHHNYRPVDYHFCTAISKKNLNKLGGFDEIYKYGLAYEDNEFISRVRSNMNVIRITKPFVVHQWHYSGNRPDAGVLTKINKRLYESNSLHSSI